PSLPLRLSLFFLPSYIAHTLLHSFPTRRSSDLHAVPQFIGVVQELVTASIPSVVDQDIDATEAFNHRGCHMLYLLGVGDIARDRSEEHTSELQSRGHLVCRLLLEKKKHNL